MSNKLKTTTDRPVPALHGCKIMHTNLSLELSTYSLFRSKHSSRQATIIVIIHDIPVLSIFWFDSSLDGGHMDYLPGQKFYLNDSFHHTYLSHKTSKKSLHFLRQTSRQDLPIVCPNSRNQKRQIMHRPMSGLLKINILDLDLFLRPHLSQIWGFLLS